jgi:hypothetical protein
MAKKKASARKKAKVSKRRPPPKAKRAATRRKSGNQNARNAERARQLEPAVQERALQRGDNQRAFVRPSGKSDDTLAEEMGRDYLLAAETNEERLEELSDEVFDEESGGPFVETSGRVEFASGVDASNPEETEREPFPTAMGAIDVRKPLSQR